MQMYSLEDAVLVLHDKSMSSEPHKAASGRLGKVVIQELDKWLRDELENRKTLPSDLIWASQEVALVMMLSVAAGMAKEGQAHLLMEALKAAHIAMLDRSIELIKSAELRT